MKNRMLRLIIVFAVALAISPVLSAQEPYKLPPKEVVDIVDAPPTPMVSASPTGDAMALIERESMPTIAYVSEPILRIAGMRITPGYNSRQVLSFSTGLSLKDMKTGLLRKIALPDGAKFTFPSWSPDGRTIALLRYVEGGVELWAVDVPTGAAKNLTPAVVNAVLGGLEWAPDSRRVIVPLVREGRGPAPVAPRVPVGPEIQISGGKEAKAATYQDLLKKRLRRGPVRLLRHVSVGRRRYRHRRRPQDRPTRHRRLDLGLPDMSCLLVERIKRPYSYALPASGFCPFDRGLGHGRRSGQGPGRPAPGRERPHQRRPQGAPRCQLDDP